jgi:methionine-rich copper-binding protein CopC
MSYPRHSSLLEDIFRACVMVAIAVSLVMVPRIALAHAVLVESSPASHGIVDGPNFPVTLKFNSRVDGSRSTLRLAAVGGASKQLTLDSQSSPDTLTAHAADLGAGKYVIQWQVLSVDGHISRGQIAFEVK